MKRIFSLLFCSLLLKLICSTFRVFGKGTNTRSQLLAGVCCYRSGRGISDITKGWLKMEEGRESKGLSFLFLTVRIETQIMAIKTWNRQKISSPEQMLLLYITDTSFFLNFETGNYYNSLKTHCFSSTGMNERQEDWGLLPPLHPLLACAPLSCILSAPTVTGG